MKRKVSICLLIIISLFTISGCGSSKKEKKSVDKTLFTIKDKKFHLDTDKEFNGLKYKVSSEFREINNITPHCVYMQYDYQPDISQNYLYLRILYYKGKDIEYAKNDYIGSEAKFEYQDIKINGIDSKMIDEKRTDGTIHHYFITKDGSTFIVDFISQNNIKTFENMVLDSICF